MTVKQFQRKAEIARETGAAALEDGMQLINHGDYWTIKTRDGNTVDTAYSPNKFEYLFD